jgi:phytoene synthase
MMCRIFGVSSADAYPRAVEMGLAMQLTNILRDIREDFEKDRIYLPAEELSARGLSVEDLLRYGPTTEWKDYIGSLIQMARGWYLSAETGLPYLQNRTCARTAKIMGRVYGGILTEIENADCDIRRRHFVPFHRKLRIAFF